MCGRADLTQRHNSSPDTGVVGDHANKMYDQNDGKIIYFLYFVTLHQHFYLIRTDIQRNYCPFYYNAVFSSFNKNTVLCILTFWSFYAGYRRITTQYDNVDICKLDSLSFVVLIIFSLRHCKGQSLKLLLAQNHEDN